MDSERWKQVDNLLQSVLECPPEQRDAFLRRACAGDQALEREVRSLLISQQQAGSFLESVAIKVAARAIVSQQDSEAMESMDRLTGRTISHYEIVEKLGEGGMGVVYKAHDTHLDRFVAIKVLPPEKLADAERKRRFIQEAKSASALNHPHIITIHDIANDNGLDFIVMEYVPGKALNQLVARRGLPLAEALKYAVQIADALAAAHKAGIIHRDLKPANVMVSGAPERSGFVKVLDFGLAKLTDKADSGDREFTQSVQQDDTPASGEGRIVGTVSYMSPEQAEGKKVDARSDIFSFGSLFYEMVTGRRAFQGESTLSTLSAVLREEPKPASQIVEGLPRELERIIARCLRKNPERRFQTMADLKVALEELKEESDSGSLGMAPARQQRPRRQLVWAGALLAALTLGLGALWFLRPPGKTPEAALNPVPLTTYPGFQFKPSFSPDGNQVAFAWNGEKQDNFDIYVKMIGTNGPPLRLTTDAAQDRFPAWSPDGRFIAFLRSLPSGKRAVLVIPAIGGLERKIAEIFSESRPTWSPDGNWLAISERDSETEPLALSLLSVETGEMRRLTSPPTHSLGDFDPAFSPDGRSLAFSRGIDAHSSGLSDLSCWPSLMDGSLLENRNRSHSGMRAFKIRSGPRMGVRSSILPGLWFRGDCGEFPPSGTVQGEPNRSGSHLWAMTLTNPRSRAEETAWLICIILIMSVSGAWRLPVRKVRGCGHSISLPPSSPRPGTIAALSSPPTARNLLSNRPALEAMKSGSAMRMVRMPCK